MYLTLIDNSSNLSLVIEVGNLFYFKISNSIGILKYNIDFPNIDYGYLLAYFKYFNFSGCLEPMYCTRLGNFYDISIYSSVNINLSYTGINLFTPYYYTFTPKLYDLSWHIYIVLYKFFNSPLIKLLLLGILYYIIVFLQTLYSFIITRLGLYLVFFSRLVRVSAYPIIRDAGISLSDRDILLILLSLGNIIFIIMNGFFDYYSFILTDRTLFNRIILGLLFLFNIISGVLASNGVYYYYHENYNGILFTILSFLSTILFSAGWFIMSVNPANINNIIINSSFRAILEALTFNSATWLTYDAWDIWLGVTNPNLLALIFLPLYLLVCTALICVEMRGARNRGLLLLLGYGLLYTMTFTFIALFTDSLYDFYSMYPRYDFVRCLIMIISAMFTTIFFPDIYRDRTRITVNVEDTNYRLTILRRAFILCLHYLIVFTAFVFLTGILFSYIRPT